MRARALLLAAVLVVALLPAGASGAVQWYEHYEAGMALEQQGRWAEAAEHFRAAARLGPRPRARVVTYGQNFLFDYDPFLHLARCLIELDRLDDAAEALRQSERFRVSPRPRLQALRLRLEGLRSQSRDAVVNRVPLAADEEDKELIHSPVPTPAGSGMDLLVTPPTPATGSTARAPVLVPSPLAAAVSTATPAVAAVVAERERPQPATPEPRDSAEASVQASPPAEDQASKEIDPSALRRPLFAALVLVAAVIGAIALMTVLDRRRRKAQATPVTLIAGGETTQVGGPDRLGPYSVRTTLGRGGMATTYRATRSSDAVTVALKVPHESCLVDEGFRSRFVREGELGRALHHPNIVRIHDVGEDRGRLYLAMELLEGRTLKQELREVGALPERRALEIVRAIAEALDYAHAKGVIHRDLKPENIMVLESGAIKVMDFGIARVAGQVGLTSTNLFLGTPLYAAPESVDARHVDHRADLYSLGIILFELLQGTAPFISESPFRVLEMHMNAPLPALSSLPRPVRAEVWAVVERLCAKDRDARFDNAASLLVDINRILHDLL